MILWKNTRLIFFEKDSTAIAEFKKGIELCDFSNNDFEFRKIKTIDGYSGPFIFSKDHAHLFNDFFRFKFRFVSYQSDNTNGHKVYSLLLKKAKFKNLNQKKLFLKGLFIRYGSINKNGIY